MRQLCFSIVAVVIATFCTCSNLSAQNDLSSLFFTTWTNGDEFIKFADKSEIEVMGIKNAGRGENLYLFIGGTLHEGGSHIWLTERDGKMYVADRDDYQMFPVGSRVELDSSGNYLIVRDGKSGQVIGTMAAISSDADWGELIEQDMLRYHLSGKYRDGMGREYEFFADEHRATGFPYKSEIFTFGVQYDIPCRILVFEGATFIADKEGDGLTLTPAAYNSEFDTYDTTGEQPLYLRKVTDNSKRDYPMLSEKILTISQILYYAGEYPLEKLGIMRNEIFAAHGYIFKGSKYRDHFQTKNWYSPKYTDVTNKLSEIELINIEHLRKLEDDYKRVQ